MIPIRQLAALLVESLLAAPAGDSVGEGLLYAPLMGLTTLDDFRQAIGAAERSGLVERLPGHAIRATARARELMAGAKVTA